ncbi:ABC transporter ATP-binding protein [Paenibacillus assamensis]|uniref:ABC transporter ATP-binding protein n=1 Tax=Paenibacillus assamensis TaxID=311244 RepID=UPI0004227A0E|nr:ABC transporter ATP-binding protein [Paenibacillus assamensis]
MTSKAIEITNLSKIYKNGRGISNLNLTVNQGDIFGFLGPNGAGKTTTMQMITGLVKPDRGDVNIFGNSITENYVDAMKHIGCMIETAESYPYLTAYEHLQLVARFYPQVDQRRIDKCMEITGILKYKNEKAKKYSVGMKQRLGIAAAILSRPKLLILDEPLNGLDFEGIFDIRRLIKELSMEEGTTFFISSQFTHDMELTCTRIGVVYSGTLVNEDYTQNILSNYPSFENYYVSEVGRNERV